MVDWTSWSTTRAARRMCRPPTRRQFSTKIVELNCLVLHRFRNMPTRSCKSAGTRRVDHQHLQRQRAGGRPRAPSPTAPPRPGWKHDHHARRGMGAEGRVNSVVVGMVETEQSELFYGDAESVAAISATVPLGGWPNPPTSVGPQHFSPLPARRTSAVRRWRCMAAASRRTTCRPQAPTNKETDKWDCSTAAWSSSRAGGGIGRAHACLRRGRGARVVVNDIGVGLDGSPAGGGRCRAVRGRRDRRRRRRSRRQRVECRRLGAGRALIQTAVDTLRRARRSGEQCRHRPGPDVRQHLRRRSSTPSPPCISRAFRDHETCRRVLARQGQRWRGPGPRCRIINTSSGAGLQGSVGQANYSAAKAGIAALTLVAAAEMGRIGVTVTRSLRRRGPG